MPSYAYALTAANVPTPIAPAAQTLLPAVAGTPVVCDSFSTGQVDGVVDGLNETAVRTDLAGRFGGGCYGIVKGLDLDQAVAGFVTIAAGQAMIDGIVEKTALISQAVAISTTSWLWLTRAGAISVGTGATPPSAPASQCAYLGRVVTNGAGTITAYDLSGVTYLRGGLPFRRTADTGLPGDAGSLSAVGAFLTRTATDLWLWDGVGYLQCSYVVVAQDFTFADGVDIAVGTGTGTKIGTSSSQKLGAFGVTPVVRPGAITQTYATATHTHSNATSADLTGISSSTTGTALAEPSVGYTQAEMQQNFRRIQDQFAALRADVLNLKQVVNGAIDDLQGEGWLQ